MRFETFQRKKGRPPANGGPLPGSFTVSATSPVFVSAAVISQVSFNGGAFSVQGNFLAPFVADKLNSNNSILLKATDLANNLATKPIPCETIISKLQ